MRIRIDPDHQSDDQDHAQLPDRDRGRDRVRGPDRGHARGQDHPRRLKVDRVGVARRAQEVALINEIFVFVQVNL